MMDDLNAAICLAAECHSGQSDKGGAPYILHPLRVMLACNSEAEQITAVLHDAVEDCGLELAHIRARFGPAIADAVDALTKRPDEDYMDFVRRCRANPIARQVKLADLADNMNMRRLGRQPTAKDVQRIEKYTIARDILLTVSIGKDS